VVLFSDSSFDIGSMVWQVRLLSNAILGGMLAWKDINIHQFDGA
jgi:hypothetical protein